MTERLVITGGCGFVGANIARTFLRALPDSEVVVLDIAGPDTVADTWFSDVASRIQFRRVDIQDRDLGTSVPDSDSVTHVVHSAMLAHVDPWEIADPRRYLDINIGGSVNVLEWARTLPNLRRFLYTSTGGVYGEPTDGSPSSPQPEDGPFNPPELYAISKMATEAILHRYADLFGFDARIVRLSGVFGPMERPTFGRTIMSAGHAIAAAVAEGRELRVSRRSFAAGGDFLSAEDIARGVHALLCARAPAYDAYNLAFGTFTTVPELLDAAVLAAPTLRYVATDHDADIDMDPANRRARWNAYDITRACEDLGWMPRPLTEQFASYFEWMSRAVPAG